MIKKIHLSYNFNIKRVKKLTHQANIIKRGMQLYTKNENSQI